MLHHKWQAFAHCRKIAAERVCAENCLGSSTPAPLGTASLSSLGEGEVTCSESWSLGNWLAPTLLLRTFHIIIVFILSLLMTYFVFLCSLTKQIFRRTKESRDTRTEGKSEGGQPFPFFSSQNCRLDDTFHHHLSPFTSSCSSLAIPLSSVLGSPRVTRHVMSSCLPRLLLGFFALLVSYFVALFQLELSAFAYY